MLFCPFAMFLAVEQTLSFICMSVDALCYSHADTLLLDDMDQSSMCMHPSPPLERYRLTISAHLQPAA